MDFSKRVYFLIDWVPEFPYFILSLYYAFTTPVGVSRHVFSLGFLYVLASLFTGLLLKHVLHTSRPRPYGRTKPFCFDVPSLHTMLSFGAIPFAYFVSPWYAVPMVPIAVLYLHSRVKLELHTQTAIAVGAVVGLLIGAVLGMLLEAIRFGIAVESFASMMFFITPVAASLYRAFRFRKSTVC